MPNFIYKSLSILTCILLSGCTSIQVQPVASEEFKNIHEICLVHNPTVTISDFVPVIKARLQQYKIAAREVKDGNTTHCQYTLRYSARRSWDIVTYLSWAELYLFKKNQLIANAEYSLVGKGGLALTKFQSVETKMNPVIDRLLGQSD